MYSSCLQRYDGRRDSLIQTGSEVAKSKGFSHIYRGLYGKETPGFVISKAERGMKIRLAGLSGETEVRCTIKSFRFSAHSLREDLLKVVTKLNPNRIILVHGDPPAIDWVGASILKENKNRRVFAAEPGKTILLDD